MNSFLLYILKSTFCISLFYLSYRMLLRKETFFRLNRILLLSAVIFSAIIPAIQLPQSIKPAAQNEWISPIQEMETTLVSQPTSEQAVQAITVPVEQPNSVLKKEFSWLKLVQNLYLAGIAISFLILIYGIVSILVLFRKARFMQMDGFRLLIIDHEIPPFSFGHFVIISQADYDAHQQTILAHEEAHIRLNHFFDLAVLETVKLFHWFNPAMYWLIRDMKEIHEFQADQYTLSKGIDATQYQILIIQKSVGPQRFALANSFNHCQIKKRITMMTKQKTSKARLWKVATFLPLLALLLMAFGKTGENAPPAQQNQEKQWTEADFGKPFYQYDKNNVPRLMIGTPIRIDSQSKIFLRDAPITLENVTEVAKKNFDYNLADDNLKKEFEKIVINGQEKMAQRFNLLYVLKHPSASAEIVQKILNSIGKAAQETRLRYASEIYKSDYQKLPVAQKNEIDKLVPAVVIVEYFPIQSQGATANQPQTTIEVRAEGIIVLPDKTTTSLGELRAKIEALVNQNKNRSISVKIATGVSATQIAKTKESLKDLKTIKYTSFDPIYLAVERNAEFPGGNQALNNWVSKNTVYPQAAKTKGLEGSVYISFIINTKGKPVDLKIQKGLSPELDTEALRVVTQMPDWKPAMQNDSPVCVRYTLPVRFKAN